MKVTNNLRSAVVKLDIILYPALIGKPDDAVVSLSGWITKGEIRTIFIKWANKFGAKLNLSPATLAATFQN